MAEDGYVAPVEGVVPQPKVAVEVNVLDFVNLALVQNGLPVVDELRVSNEGDEPIKDATCSFFSDDALVVPTEVFLGDIPAHGTIRKSGLGVNLNARRIVDACEGSERSSVTVEIRAGGESLAAVKRPVTVLKPNQWLGVRPYPELVAAYVLADEDLVKRLQSEAALELEAATGASSLEGYQGGKRRVLEECAAIFTAIRKLGISYAEPPATFADPGQAVRLPGEIEKYRLATCLDMALLMAAVMEACRLHPVVALTRTHAYVACHLIDATFDEVTVSSVESLRKRADMDELVAIETVLATADSSFNEAERRGRALLDDEESFVCAIDVVRSRESAVRPIFAGGALDSGYLSQGRTVAEVDDAGVRELNESVDLESLKGGQSAAGGRIGRWTQKLLDFSARNRLLNIPSNSRQVLPIVCSNIALLEDHIAANSAMAIRPVSEAVGEKALEDISEGRLDRAQLSAIVDQELSRKRLIVLMGEREARRRLSELYHDARTELEESGLNTLFLAIGSLKWVDPGAKGKSYRAPILMIPVRLERASMVEGVKMYRLDEDTTVNATLLEFMRAQFNLSVPGLDPLPTDDSGVDVAKVLQIFRQAVRDMPGWEVLEEAHLGCFSFGKFVMWKDMTERSDELKRHPLVNHLVGGGGFFDDGIEVFPANEIAAHFDPSRLYCPVSYDSSQLAAVLYSEMGKSFVLHGPPGTGKSQTITNIIAHNLALGRRVLFVSEKKAALDVVKERLDRIGLTPFCLELHSNKTEKSRFYSQIKDALQVPDTAQGGEWESVVASFEKCRGELGGYVASLHKSYPNGLSAYDCLQRAIAGGEQPPQSLIEADVLSQSREGRLEAREAVCCLLESFRGVGEDALRYTPAIKAQTWSPALERSIGEAASALAQEADAIAPHIASAMESLGMSGDISHGDASLLVDDLKEMLAHPSAVPSGVLRLGPNATPRRIGELLSMASRRAALAAKLSSYRLEAIAEIDLAGVERRLAENSASFFLVRFFRDRSLAKELASIVRPGAGKLTASRLRADVPAMKEYLSLGESFREMTLVSPDETTQLDGALRTEAESVVELWPRFEGARAALLEHVEAPSIDGAVLSLGDSMRGFIDSIGEMRSVMRYREAEKRASGLGVGAFAGYISANDDGNLDAAEAYDNVYAAKMLDGILKGDSVLAGFSGQGHEAAIEKFRGVNSKYMELTRRAVFAKLAASLPRRRAGICPEGTELGMLKRECEKKSRQKAVRLALSEAKTLLPQLKPCFLMSPLSVAQYLPVDSKPFDLIVFDEASQIPVWDAIGVIARGRQLIVVGDPKQMPPTSFFQKGEAEGEDSPIEAPLDDQESILDECLVAGVHSTYLNWHYRSRHESLIAFSNERYYSNKLCTFPSASASPRLGVKFMFVEGGLFEKAGRGPRVNRVEAKALVDYIESEVLKPGYRRRSIGIVTFSQPQQRLIRTMLDERRSENPELERLLPEEGEGAYFVKNLENVQGDESDVILFSVGYAPDENGRFTMNFGPLNLSGGERRLNVAVTRAKEQVVVFSSVHASQIDAGEDGRTKAVGASHLKAFLDYAERGPTAASAAEGPSQDGMFADTVAKFLEASGYVIERHVGCSQHKIDIAVKNDAGDGYLMGIECDGPSYARQLTVQDRDLNRPGVLKGLGWHTCRVWSVDWAFDRERSQRRLLEKLEAARLDAGSSAAPAEPAGDSASKAPAADFSQATFPAAEESYDPATRHPVYRVWKTSSRNLSHERFYEPQSAQKISAMIRAVVDTEGPVCETVLKRRVSKAWGITRMTDAVHRLLDSATGADIRSSAHDSGRVFWPQGMEPEAYRDYRVPGRDPDSRRPLDEIPPEEIANAMREILEDLGECQRDGLYRETMRLFGLATLTAKARRFMDAAYVIANGEGV